MITSFGLRAGGFVATLLLAGALTGRAQQTAGAPALPTPNSSRALVYKAAPPEQRADKMSQEIARQLSLDAATMAKVRTAALTRDQKIDAIQNGPASNKDKNTALQANAQEFKTALQSILTPAQYAQYTAHGGKSHAGQPTGKPLATPAAAPAPAN